MYDLFYQRLLLYLKYHIKKFSKFTFAYNSWYDCFIYSTDFESGCLECLT